MRMDLRRENKKVVSTRVTHLLVSIVKSKTLYNFFTKDPKEFVEIRGIDPNSLDLNALTNAAKDLAAHYNWWTAKLDWADVLRSTTQSYSHTGARKNFNPDTKSETKAHSMVTSHKKFDGDHTGDIYIYELRTIENLKNVQADILPLVTPAIIDSICQVR